MKIWSILESSSSIGYINNYLKKTLAEMGFESVGAFRKIETDEYEILFKAIEDTIREISMRDEGDKLKQEIKEDLRDNNRQLDATFNLPWGHRNIIKSIIDFSKCPPPATPSYYIIENQTQDSASHSSSLHSSATSLSTLKIEKEIETFTNLCSKFVTNDLIHNLLPLRDLQVYIIEDEWFVDCPFCTLSLKIYVKRGSHKVWSFQRHLVDVHKTFPYLNVKKPGKDKEKIEIQSNIVLNTNKDQEEIEKPIENFEKNYGEKSGEKSSSKVVEEKSTQLEALNSGSSGLSPPQKILLLGKSKVSTKIPLRINTKINEVRSF